MGAESPWIVSVLNVGAADASNGNSEKPISPRMTKEDGEMMLCPPATFEDQKEMKNAEVCEE
jgi:hypothetical protein